jgi:RNA recognition motif-containing protein
MPDGDGPPKDEKSTLQMQAGQQHGQQQQEEGAMSSSIHGQGVSNRFADQQTSDYFTYTPVPVLAHPSSYMVTAYNSYTPSYFTAIPVASLANFRPYGQQPGMMPGVPAEWNHYHPPGFYYMPNGLVSTSASPMLVVPNDLQHQVQVPTTENSDTDSVRQYHEKLHSLYSKYNVLSKQSSSTSGSVPSMQSSGPNSISSFVKDERNVYLQGLPPDTTEESLAGFIPEGLREKLLSSKIIFNQDIKSHSLGQTELVNNTQCKGYAFLLFSDSASASAFINHINTANIPTESNMAVKQKIHASIAKESFSSRLRELGAGKESNLYFANIPPHFAENDLVEVVEKKLQVSGAVESSKILRSSDGKSRCVGFVRFKKPQNAALCLNEMNGFLIEG